MRGTRRGCQLIAAARDAMEVLSLYAGLVFAVSQTQRRSTREACAVIVLALCAILASSLALCGAVFWLNSSMCSVLVEQQHGVYTAAVPQVGGSVTGVFPDTKCISYIADLAELLLHVAEPLQLYMPSQAQAGERCRTPLQRAR